MQTIRPAAAGDIPALSRLLGLLFAQEAEFSPDAEAQSHGLRHIINAPDGGTILVLVDGDTPVGMVSLLYLTSTALGSPVALLEDLVIDPAHRGRGCGERLLRAAIDHARACGCRRITLLTDGDNIGAQRFYARAGFAGSAMVPMRLALD